MSLEQSKKTVVSVGPFGELNKRAIPFDDGVHSAVKGLEIVHWKAERGHILNVRFEYEDDGISVWGDKHGTNIIWDVLGGLLATDGDMRRECIRFNYPDEFLTSVYGNYEANLSGSWLSSLTFNTNRKTYGPFGSTPNRNRRSYFSIHVPGSKIVGFHGRSHRWWSTNFDIGAYLKPIDQQSEYATSTALMLYPSEPPHQPGYPSQTKLNKDDRPQNQKHYAVSNIRVSRNEGDHNGAFYLGDRYKYTNYYIEKADIAHK